jgi:hypothetical protein
MKAQTNFKAAFNPFSIAHGILSKAIQKFSGINFTFSNMNQITFPIHSQSATNQTDIVFNHKIKACQIQTLHCKRKLNKNANFVQISVTLQPISAQTSFEKVSQAILIAFVPVI